MSIYYRLEAALENIAPVLPAGYEPDEGTNITDTYIVMRYDSIPADFGDDEPAHEIFSLSVRLFCPSGTDSSAMRREIKEALVAAGFSWPAYTDASDKNGQHHIFECECAEVVGLE